VCKLPLALVLEMGLPMKNATMEITSPKTKLIDIRRDNFESEVLQSPIPVFLEFGASWCGPCHIIAPGIDKLAREFKGRIKFCFLDVDEYPDIKDGLGVRDLPTIILFRDGEVEDFIVGTKPTLEVKSSLEEILLKR